MLDRWLQQQFTSAGPKRRRRQYHRHPPPNVTGSSTCYGHIGGSAQGTPSLPGAACAALHALDLGTLRRHRHADQVDRLKDRAKDIALRWARRHLSMRAGLDHGDGVNRFGGLIVWVAPSARTNLHHWTDCAANCAIFCDWFPGGLIYRGALSAGAGCHGHLGR